MKPSGPSGIRPWALSFSIPALLNHPVGPVLSDELEPLSGLLRKSPHEFNKAFNALLNAGRRKRS